MTVKIIEVDKAKKRIVASRKAYLLDEKKKAWEKIEKDQIVTGIVRRLTDFGAFVDIGGVDGLIHVTDLAWHRVKHPSEVVTPGQEVTVKIIGVDKEKERIQLSLKALQPQPWDVAEEKYPEGSIVEGKVGPHHHLRCVRGAGAGPRRSGSHLPVRAQAYRQG